MAAQERIYERASSAVFAVIKAPMGELSNFHPAMPLVIPTENGLVNVDSNETFYQSDKFRDRPDLQEKILAAAAAHSNGPRGAKDMA